MNGVTFGAIVTMFSASFMSMIMSIFCIIEGIKMLKLHIKERNFFQLGIYLALSIISTIIYTPGTIEVTQREHIEFAAIYIIIFSAFANPIVYIGTYYVIQKIRKSWKDEKKYEVD